MSLLLNLSSPRYFLRILCFFPNSQSSTATSGIFCQFIITSRNGLSYDSEWDRCIPKYVLLDFALNVTGSHEILDHSVFQ